ncbi:MAG: hypothetical protein NTX16_11240 [Actinobacteria bacterium]|nr:hypothetical protein [Actinomycetota bacterium]
MHLPFPEAALCERLPNMDVTMTRGWPEDVPPEVGQLAHVVALPRGTRNPLLLTPINGKSLALIQEMPAVWSQKDGFDVSAMPPPPQHDAKALAPRGASVRPDQRAG